MKIFRLLATFLFVAMLCAISVSAQAVASASTKIAIINTNAFADEKAGITKFSVAILALRKEFEPAELEIKSIGTRYENLRKEIEGLQNQLSKPGSIVSEASIQPKIDEYGKLERDIKFRQEDANARYQSRFNILIRPIIEDINKGIQDYAKQKGYALIFDEAKLNETALIIGIGDEKVDVTKDFIAYYNARATVPKSN